VPYTDAEIAGAAEEVKGKTEQDALIAYLQVLGRALSDQLAAQAAAASVPASAPAAPVSAP
jgi:cytochrome c oxidase cbb3-type subunit 2